MGYRIIILLILSISFLSCRVHLKELRSTSQLWCVPQNNLYGINYHLTFKTLADYNKIKIDSLWLHNSWIKNFHYSVIGKSNTETRFFKGDTVLVSINIMDTLSSGIILVKYSFKNKSRTVIIKNIKNLKSLCY